MKQLETQLASSISAATEVMSLGELAAFVDSVVTKLTAASKIRGRVRDQPKPRARTTAPTG